MADDKRNRRDQSPSGTPRPNQPGGRDRKPGGIESPGSGRSRREEDQEPQE
jgi:hypothetical protein